MWKQGPRQINITGSWRKVIICGVKWSWDWSIKGCLLCLFPQQSSLSPLDGLSVLAPLTELPQLPLPVVDGNATRVLLAASEKGSEGEYGGNHPLGLFWNCKIILWEHVDYPRSHLSRSHVLYHCFLSANSHTSSVLDCSTKEMFNDKIFAPKNYWWKSDAVLVVSSSP